MRITCPHCGERDIREFTYRGAALERPQSDASPEEWNDYIHLRDNPAGDTKDLWYHSGGCATWIVVERNTVSHQVHGSFAVAENGMARK